MWTKKECHGKVVNWPLEFKQKYNFPINKKWWERKSEKIIVNEQAKILKGLWTTIRDRHLHYNTPDITRYDCIAVTLSSKDKEHEKMTGFKDLQIKIEPIWGKE